MLSPHTSGTKAPLQNLRGPLKNENLLKSPKESEDCTALSQAWGPFRSVGPT